MEERKYARIGDIVEVNASTYSSRDDWEFVNYLDTGNITENIIDSIQRFDLSKESLPSRARRKVRKNSIVYSTVRPNQRHYGIVKSVPDNFIVSTGFAVLDADEKIVNADYLYYYLTQDTVIEQFQALAEQSVSTYPSIKPSAIEDLLIPLPDIDTQQRIASILLAVDDKIKKNREINDNLCA